MRAQDGTKLTLNGWCFIFFVHKSVRNPQGLKTSSEVTFGVEIRERDTTGAHLEEN